MAKSIGILRRVLDKVEGLIAFASIGWAIESSLHLPGCIINLFYFDYVKLIVNLI